jgi:hypothetical protein
MQYHRHLELQPDANVSRQVLPSTLFGEQHTQQLESLLL